LTKNIFQVHGVDERGKTVLRKTLKRAEVASFFAKLAQCVIGMEACGSAHFWARKLSEFGHTVRLMAPQFVKPYVKSNKNDARDAQAICEAAGRPNMRFVPIKNVEQQALLAVHRVRQGFVSAHTAQSNQIRGLLSEFGIVMPRHLQRDGNQVRPGLTKPARFSGTSESADLIRRQPAHSIRARGQVPYIEAECMAAIST
jgi:transposase